MNYCKTFVFVNVLWTCASHCCYFVKEKYNKEEADWGGGEGEQWLEREGSYKLLSHYRSSTYLRSQQVLQLIKKFPAFYGTRKFITVLTSARHLSLSWANSIQSPQPLPTSWRSILILSSHLRLGLANGLFPSGFPTKTLCTPLPSSVRHTQRKISAICTKIPMNCCDPSSAPTEERSVSYSCRCATLPWHADIRFLYNQLHLVHSVYFLIVFRCCCRITVL